MTPRQEIEDLRRKGVVGAGGAGFPTYQKLTRSAEVVIVNAAECEPLLHKDKELLHHYKDEVLAGLARVGELVGAERRVIAIKDKYEDLIRDLEVVVAGSGVEVFRLGDFYPAGDEFITVYDVTGRVIPPGGLPLDVGCVVQNVETLVNVARTGPVTHKYLSVAGAVPEPVTVRAPIGITFGDVLRSLGLDPSGIGHVLVGGVMMGRKMESWSEPVTRTTGALLCFPEDHPLPRRYATEVATQNRIGRSACDQCRFCTEMCPRYLLGHPVEPHNAMRGLGFNLRGEDAILGSQFCCECNLCTLYACPEDLFPMQACRNDKVQLRELGVQHPDTGHTDVKAHSMAAYRRIPVSSLMRKLGLTDFRNVGPLVEVDWRPTELRIPLKQHIGAPARAVVSAGDRVDAGQVIGEVPEGELGVPIHASLAGEVVATGEAVVIRPQER